MASKLEQTGGNKLKFRLFNFCNANSAIEHVNFPFYPLDISPIGLVLVPEWRLKPFFRLKNCSPQISNFVLVFDRYWSVSSLHYSQGRSLQRMTYTIIAIWLAAAVVSMPPLLGVKDAEYDLRLQNGKCLMSQDIGYQVSKTLYC